MPQQPSQPGVQMPLGIVEELKKIDMADKHTIQIKFLTKLLIIDYLFIFLQSLVLN